MSRGFDYWGPIWCMILVTLTVVLSPLLGVWTGILMVVIGIFAAVMAIVRRKV